MQQTDLLILREARRIADALESISLTLQNLEKLDTTLFAPLFTPGPVVCQNQLADPDPDRPTWTTAIAARYLNHSQNYVVDRLNEGSIEGYKDTQSNRWCAYRDSVVAFKNRTWGELPDSE